MPSCVITVYGYGQARLLRELMGMLTHRGADVRSVSATVGDGHCHIQLGVEATDEQAIELLVKRINRIVGVVKTVRVDDESAHQRVLTMVHVNANASVRTQLLELARALGAEVVEITPRTVVLCLVAPPRREHELLDLLEPFGICEIAQSDPVVLRRTRRPRAAGTKTLSVVPA